jgi:uncharacterized protein
MSMPLVPEPPPPRPTPYTLWPTMGLFVAVFVLHNIIGGLVALAMAAHAGKTTPEALSEYVKSLTSNGVFLTVSTLIATPLLIGLLVLLANTRGYAAAEYFALNRVRARTIFFWLGMVVAFALLNGLVNQLAGHAEVAPFMLDAYRTSWPPLLLFAVAFLAPVYEELFFRGLLFRGFLGTEWGQGGAGRAVLLTAFLFAILHIQYDAFDIASIFALGVLLGVARQATGSTWTTIAMHAFTNFVSTIEVALRAHGLH